MAKSRKVIGRRKVILYCADCSTKIAPTGYREFEVVEYKDRYEYICQVCGAVTVRDK